MDLNYFDYLYNKNGPEYSDYPYLSNWFSQTNQSLKDSSNPKKLRLQLFKSFPELFNLESIPGFIAQKPHGYAGDFEIIDRFYTRRISSNPKLSRWDLYSQSLPAVKAIRNRKLYFKKLVQGFRNRSNNRPIRILNVGSGPARDIFEYFIDHPLDCIHVDCVDSDKMAIHFAQTLCQLFNKNIHFIHKNIFRFKPDKHYDLIWSAGLFDYLNDTCFFWLLKRLYSFFNPGGEVVVGNFSPNNPNSDVMAVLGWHLKYRNNYELKELSKNLNGGYTVRIAAEEQKVNLFLHIRKN